jgi:hypothetical protein
MMTKRTNNGSIVTKAHSAYRHPLGAKVLSWLSVLLVFAISIPPVLGAEAYGAKALFDLSDIAAAPAAPRQSRQKLPMHGDPTQGHTAVKISVNLERDGRVSPVPLSTRFRSGDKISITFVTTKDAYVYLVNVGSSGQLQLLWPSGTNPVMARAGQRYEVPERRRLVFDNTPGQEQLIFQLASSPIDPLQRIHQLSRPSPSPLSQQPEPQNYASRDFMKENDVAGSQPATYMAAANSRLVEGGVIQEDLYLIHDRR